MKTNIKKKEKQRKTKKKINIKGGNNIVHEGIVEHTYRVGEYLQSSNKNTQNTYDYFILKLILKKNNNNICILKNITSDEILYIDDLSENVPGLMVFGVDYVKCKKTPPMLIKENMYLYNNIVYEIGDILIKNKIKYIVIKFESDKVILKRTDFKIVRELLTELSNYSLQSNINLSSLYDFLLSISIDEIEYLLYLIDDIIQKYSILSLVDCNRRKNSPLENCIIKYMLKNVITIDSILNTDDCLISVRSGREYKTTQIREENDTFVFDLELIGSKDREQKIGNKIIAVGTELVPIGCR
jgi:hypothetical protein